MDECFACALQWDACLGRRALRCDTATRRLVILEDPTFSEVLGSVNARCNTGFYSRISPTLVLGWCALSDCENSVGRLEMAVTCVCFVGRQVRVIALLYVTKFCCCCRRLMDLHPRHACAVLRQCEPLCLRVYGEADELAMQFAAYAALDVVEEQCE